MNVLMKFFAFVFLSKDARLLGDEIKHRGTDIEVHESDCGWSISARSSRK